MSEDATQEEADHPPTSPTGTGTIRRIDSATDWF